MKKREKELACAACLGAIALVKAAYRCEACGRIHAALAEAKLSGKTRERQHEPGGYPNNPRRFR